MRTFTPEEIQRLTLKDLAALRTDFPDATWTPELASILEALHEIASTSGRDFARLTDLEQRMSQLIRENKLKGLTPILWMITSLKPTETNHVA